MHSHIRNGSCIVSILIGSAAIVVITTSCWDCMFHIAKLVPILRGTMQISKQPRTVIKSYIRKRCRVVIIPGLSTRMINDPKLLPKHDETICNRKKKHSAGSNSIPCIRNLSRGADISLFELFRVPGEENLNFSTRSMFNDSFFAPTSEIGFAYRIRI